MYMTSLRVADENEINGTFRNSEIATDSASIVMFGVTDLLTGKHYSVKDTGSYYELQFPTGNGPINVKLDRETDLVEVAYSYLTSSLYVANLNLFKLRNHARGDRPNRC
jgi:hypothetical protein